MVGCLSIKASSKGTVTILPSNSNSCGHQCPVPSIFVYTPRPAPLIYNSNEPQASPSVVLVHSRPLSLSLLLSRLHLKAPTTILSAPADIFSSMEGTVIHEHKEEASGSGKKKIFVAGATGTAGKSIVEHLLAKGFAVKAGVRNVEKAKTMFPGNEPDLQFVKCDVTEGSAKLADAIGDDSDAVICAIGVRPSWNFLAPWKIEYTGTVNLVDACKTRRVDRVILISSLLVNAAAMGILFVPVYILINLLGFLFIAKLRAERYLRKSGINYTIVRPGEITKGPPSGNIVMEPEDTLYWGSLSRDQFAEVVVEALIHPESSNKVVEIVARTDAPKRSLQELWGTKKEQ